MNNKSFKLFHFKRSVVTDTSNEVTEINVLQLEKSVVTDTKAKFNGNTEKPQKKITTFNWQKSISIAGKVISAIWSICKLVFNI